MRCSRLAAPIALLSLAIAGCGGGQVTVQQLSSGPVTLAPTAKSDQLAPDATPKPTATASATATPDADATAATGTQPQTQPQASTQTQTTTGGDAGTQTQAPTSSAGGGATAPDAPSAEQTPAAGSDKQKYEAFCAQNPGAC